MRGTMPAPDSSSPAAQTPLSSIGRSIGWSLHRRDQNQIHSFPPTPDDATDAFQRRAADLLADLLAAPDDVLSLAWTRRLLDAFLLCLEEFRALLFGGGSGSGSAAAARPPLDRLVADFFDRAVKALDLCNAVRDGLDLVRQWRKHLAIAAAVLASSSSASASAPSPPLGEAQIRRARKALTDLTILMLDDRDGGGVVGQRNRSFGRPANPTNDKSSRGHGHHRRSSSGGSSGSGSGSHLRSLSWSVSRAWSAARQLQAIGGSLPVPRPQDNAATGGLASAVYTMGAVLFIVAFALVAAIPCQDRGLQAHFSVPRSLPCSGPITTLYDRILEESKKKERKNSSGLLKEIHQIELYSRKLMEITDAAEFPLHEDKDAEVREAAQDLVHLCQSIKEGLDPLERQVREMFHRIVRTRTEILDCLSKPHATQ